MTPAAAGGIPRRSVEAADLAVIGGGAAGFMAAISAAEESRRPLSITVLERGGPLAKLLLTGGGRCNLANDTRDAADLVSRYPRGGKFLRSVFARFGPAETMAWFSAKGLPLRRQPDGRVFPASEKAADVRDFLLEEAGRRGVTLRPRFPVGGLSREGAGFLISGAPPVPFRARKVIIATGGDPGGRPPSGYELARGLGHTVTPLRPALVSLAARDRWIAGLAGVSLPDVAIEARFGGKKAAAVRGEMVFTHRGISGPAVLNLSSLAAFLGYGPGAPLSLMLNLVPEVAAEPERRLLHEISLHPARRLAGVLGTMIPRVLAAALLTSAGIDPAKRAGEVTRQERKTAAALLAAAPLTVTGPAPEGEMVTAGGVDLDEVDPKSMASRLVDGLYFAGEILDIDGFSGGFNLQAAWSTGHLAGISAARSLGG